MRDLLVTYFDSKSKLTLLAVESDLDPSYIADKGTSREYCTNIILEAQKQGRLSGLVANAYKEYATPYLRIAAYIIREIDCGTITSEAKFTNCYTILADVNLTHTQWLQIYQSIWTDPTTSLFFQHLDAMWPEYGFWSTQNTVFCVLIDLWEESTEQNRNKKLKQLFTKITEQTGEQYPSNWSSAPPSPPKASNPAETNGQAGQDSKIQQEDDSDDGTGEFDWYAPIPFTPTAISTLITLISISWFVHTPSYEPLLAILASISGIFAVHKGKDSGKSRWDAAAAGVIAASAISAIIIIQIRNVEQLSVESIDIMGLYFMAVAVGGASVTIGLLLLLVGSGIYAYAPNMRLKLQRSVGNPNIFEMILGLLVTLGGILTLVQIFGAIPIAALSLRTAISFDLLLIALIFLLGYIRLETFTVYKRRRNKSANLPARLFGVLLAVLAAWLGIFAPLSSPSPLPTPVKSTPESPTMAIVKFDNEYLQDGGQVPPVIPYLSGTYEGIPQDENLWIVLQSGSRCYPVDGPAMLERTNTWRYGAVQFPQAEREYLVHAVVADNAASNQFRLAVGKTTGLQCFPNGAESVEILAVTVDPS